MKAAVLMVAMFGLLLTIPAHAQNRPKALLLFGGTDHKTFLGCLNCVSTSPVSICNEYGTYGSEYNSGSIWNEYGNFGSSYSMESPWDSYSTEAPIIVDKDGNSYGYFSTNGFILNRTKIGWLVKVLDFENSKDDLGETRKYMCGDN